MPILIQATPLSTSPFFPSLCPSDSIHPIPSSRPECALFWPGLVLGARYYYPVQCGRGCSTIRSLLRFGSALTSRRGSERGQRQAAAHTVLGRRLVLRIRLSSFLATRPVVACSPALPSFTPWSWTLDSGQHDCKKNPPSRRIWLPMTIADTTTPRHQRSLHADCQNSRTSGATRHIAHRPTQHVHIPGPRADPRSASHARAGIRERCARGLTARGLPGRDVGQVRASRFTQQPDSVGTFIRRPRPTSCLAKASSLASAPGILCHSRLPHGLPACDPTDAPALQRSTTQSHSAAPLFPLWSVPGYRLPRPLSLLVFV